MKDFKKSLKAFVLLLGLALLLPLSANAQYYKGSLLNDDPTARWQQQDGLMNNRDIVTWTAANGIFNNGIGQSEVPVGSGLLILSAAGLGYAALRRKRSRKGTALLLAGVMLLGFSQCKKEQTLEPNQDEKVHITLTVNGGSRASVTPGEDYATVTFEDGDVIYVGYNNACIGSLAYNAEAKTFGGDVDFVQQVDEQYLHFYFLGNKTPTITETTKYTVDIIDQTSKYPVISYNHSNEVYTGEGEYTATLFNYCSIMKFTTNNVADINSQVLCITGMNNTVTVDFNGNGITYGSKDDGLIKMPTSGSNVRWAIVLPQEELAAGSYGSVYTPNECFKGSRPSLDEIERNEYLKAGKELKLYDVRFSISSTQKVLFSPGNLLKTDASYEVGSGSETYAFEATPFNTNGGSLGYGGDAPSATSARGYFTWNEIATANETPREFTVNGVSGWKAMTYDEFEYLLMGDEWDNGRTMNQGVSRKYNVDLEAKGEKIGILIPPDQATLDDVNGLTSGSLTQNVNINTYISKGFVFLPCVGWYTPGWFGWATSTGSTGVTGYYWCTTEEDDDWAYYFQFHAAPGYGDDNDEKYYYCSVRLVRDVE